MIRYIFSTPASKVTCVYYWQSKQGLFRVLVTGVVVVEEIQAGVGEALLALGEADRVVGEVGD